MKVGEKERERRLWAALDCARLYSTELYCASLYWTTLCCTALYYTVYSAVTPGCSPGFRVRPPQRLLQQGPDKALDEEVCVLVMTRSSAGENRAGRYSAVQCSAVQCKAVQCRKEYYSRGLLCCLLRHSYSVCDSFLTHPLYIHLSLSYSLIFFPCPYTITCLFF
jgi:hypothetical protein